MVERFNGRIAAILKATAFDCREDLEATLYSYQYTYNHCIPQKALGHIAPIEKLKSYYKASPELLGLNQSIVRNLTVSQLNHIFLTDLLKHSDDFSLKCLKANNIKTAIPAN